ncbi:hypothetical protein RJ639_033494 [Escallonia herrerae]|uniref:Uncharacterized protein n=1 Tax=Escallonia herrerae TaxID=1293975 RepID=A0AA88WU96_9ASTE|nr:hypothetical protein RJ639_033494 [Escallonia herrerae]
MVLEVSRGGGRRPIVIVLWLNFVMKVMVCLVLRLFGNVGAAPESALITSLPGFSGTFPSKHYSGYVTVDRKPSPKNFFYYFVSSERNPLKDPVVLWLNGGPGCSSFDGFVYEHAAALYAAGDLEVKLN